MLPNSTILYCTVIHKMSTLLKIIKKITLGATDISFIRGMVA